MLIIYMSTSFENYLSSDPTQAFNIIIIPSIPPSFLNNNKKKIPSRSHAQTQNCNRHFSFKLYNRISSTFTLKYTDISFSINKLLFTAFILSQMQYKRYPFVSFYLPLEAIHLTQIFRLVGLSYLSRL